MLPEIIPNDNDWNKLLGKKYFFIDRESKKKKIVNINFKTYRSHIIARTLWKENQLPIKYI